MIQADEPFDCHLRKLDKRHITNLAYILELGDGPASPESICDAVRWRYYSRAREAVIASPSLVGAKAKQLLGRQVESAPAPELPLTYNMLIAGLATKLGVFDEDLSGEQLEKRVIYTVISECLQRMTPEQRVGFFEHTVDVDAVLGDGIVSKGVGAPLRTLSLIGVASTSGLGLFAAAATALGMVTHAVGLSLPAMISTGVTSTVGFLLGPAGWMAAGGWLAWRITGPDWRVLTQVVVYLITEKHNPDDHAQKG